MNTVVRIALIGFFCCFMGCSLFENRYVESGAIGGGIGAVGGAATGAAVGAIISNGDIAASALLGASIGLPAGIVLGLVYQYYADESELDENNNEILENYQYIVRRQAEIDELREEIAIDYQTIRVDKRKRDQIFTGATIGTYNR